MGAAPEVLTGVDRRVDGLDETRPGNGVDGPELVAECIGAGDVLWEPFAEVGMMCCTRCVGSGVVDMHQEFALGCEKENVSDSSMIRVIEDLSRGKM